MFVRGETDCGECALIRSDSFLTITAFFLAAPGLLTAQGYDQTVKPFLQQNCLACHSEAAKVADVVGAGKADVTLVRGSHQRIPDFMKESTTCLCRTR